MNKKISLVVACLSLVSATESFAQQTCDGALRTLRTIEGSRVSSLERGPPAIYFRANMDVNTDGTARSYHPNDPLGTSLAFNNIANAITSRTDSNGKPDSCKPRKGACFMAYIKAFEAARDSDWATSGVPQIKTKWIIPWRLNEETGRRSPCLIDSGPYKGYFVSQTSAILNPQLGECEQSRYVDALTIRAVVLPDSHGFRSQGIAVDSTDAVIVRDRATGQFQFALVGDTGPADKIGEGSIALAATLSNRHLAGNESYSIIKSLARPDVDYLVLPRTDIVRLRNGRVDNSEIDRIVGVAFQAWGGQTRFNSCFGRVGP